MDKKKTDITPTKRSADLNAHFIDGYADGWFMAVKDSFKMELDIKLTERKKNKVSYSEWTQGPYYCFSEGQVIYDAKDAYTCWHSAMHNINLACQIVTATPNIPIKIDSESSSKSEFRVVEGYVHFLLFKPDEGRTKLFPYIGYKLSQDDFVNFLKTGTL